MDPDDLIARLRSDLTAAGYAVDALEALWGEDAAAALHRGHRFPAQRRLDTARPLDALAALFVLGLPVAAEDAERALPSLGVAGAASMGLVAAGQVVRPLLDLRPYTFVDAEGAGAWWIASDLSEIALGHAIPEDHVLGVGGASTTLSSLQTPDRVGTVLDLGTGCGIQAMHASRHSIRLVATDVSTRALEIARLNASLNGIESIEFRLGSLFEPVAGERFDRIVSNPPFVITPRVEGVPAYEYRDGGLVGDALVESVVTGVETHLEPGGMAQLLGNWEYRDGDGDGVDGLDRVRGWVESTGLDAWVVEREVQDAALYAETWIRDGGTRPGSPEFDVLYRAWLDDFTARGVTRVGFGYLTLRRPRYPGIRRLRRFERMTTPLGHDLGRATSALFGAWDELAVLTDAELAHERLAVAGDVTEERHYWPGDEHPAVITLRRGGGFARETPAGTALAAVVGACDGELELGVICAAVADLLEADAAALTAEVVVEVRELVLTGMLSIAR